jgi:hypothetical protein
MRRTCLGGRRRTALAVAVAAALFPCAAWAQRAEGSFQRTLNVSGQPEIDIVSGSGSIEVRRGSAGRVEISARIQANDGWNWGRRSQLSPEERVKRIEANPPVEQKANAVRIGYITSDELREGVSISYVVTVPARSSLRSKTGSGSQEVSGIDGNVETATGSGSLRITDTGGDLHASTGSGSIDATSIGGALYASTSSGSISATGVKAGITARTGSGRIDLTQSGSGNVEVSSGSGSVRLKGVHGAVRASTSSGGLTIEGNLSGDWDLSAGSGSVTIDLPSSQGFELDATTGSGNIAVDAPVTVRGTINKRSLRGTVHGGGPLLHVRTSSGGISIR